MKKVISTILAILMLIPAVAMLGYANDVVQANAVTLSDETHEGTNIVSQATLKYFSVASNGDIAYVDMDKTTTKVDYKKVVDGDKSTGTNTGYTGIYAFELTFDQAIYATDLVLYVNGDGTLPGGGSVSNSNALDLVTIKMYKAGEEVFSQEVSTQNQTTVTVSTEAAIDKIEIYRDQSKFSTSDRGKDFFREIEVYSIEKEFCNVVKSNIASEAFVSAAGTNEGDYCDTWWAWEPKALTDGKKDVGTRSPKGWNYSVFVDFTKDYLISELVLTLNGKGELLNSGSVKDVAMNISQIRVKLFNLEGEMVYDSKAIGVDTTEVKLDPFVEASRIKIEIANGKGEGSEFLWEIETYVEEGDHIFEQTGDQNPTCNRPGYKEYSCHCGKVIKKSVPATGFHVWDEGYEKVPATNDGNGVLVKTCQVCRETKAFDIPSTGHNWDSGVVTKPTCVADGYTLYTCKDAGCDANYKKDIIEALGHDWNAGVITQKATVSSYGEKQFTCLREGCGVVEKRQTRKLQYTDSITNFEFEEGKYQVEVDYNENDALYNPNKDAQYPLITDPKEFNAVVDDDISTYWYGPTGSTYTITLDREYVFTKGTLYASGNNTTLKVEWINAQGKVTATYSTKWNTISVLNKDNPLSISMSEALTSGAVAKQIRITLTGAKWVNGWAMSVHGMDLIVHDCSYSESDYIKSGSSYVAPTCTKDGSCLAECPVCGNTTTVTLESEKYGHNVVNPTPDVLPTCSDAGYGHGQCTKCGDIIENVVIPALGSHVYDKEIEFMPAKCGAAGIKQIVCAGCGRVGSQTPIPATEEHTPVWTEDYCASYTAEGREVYKCTGCGLLDDENGVYEKIIPKKSLADDFVKFVDYSVRTTDFAGIRLTYKIDMEMLAEIEYECDVRIITTVTNSNGVSKTVESYGKYSDDRYNAETGEFAVVIKPSSYYEEYEVSTVVRLMNFRGVEYYDIELGELSTDNNSKISLCEVAEYVLGANSSLSAGEKSFLEGIVAGK